MRQYAYFSELPPRTLFALNGTEYTKASTRTARDNSGRVWYFRNFELAIVGPHSRL